jgi:hypothetical protein
VECEVGKAGIKGKASKASKGGMILLKGSDATKYSPPPPKKKNGKKKSKSKKSKKKKMDDPNVKHDYVAKYIDRVAVSTRTRCRGIASIDEFGWNVDASGQPSVEDLISYSFPQSLNLNNVASKAVKDEAHHAGNQVDPTILITENDFSYIPLGGRPEDTRNKSWSCHLSFLGRVFGGAKLHDLPFPVEQRGWFDDPDGGGGLIPGYRTKRDAKQVALMHAATHADGAHSAFVEHQLQEEQSIAFYHHGGDDGKPWVVFYLIPGEIWLCWGTNPKEGLPRLRIP